MDSQFYTGIKRKKNKLDCAFFLPGELFFFFNHPFPVRDPKLVILRLRFLTGGGAEKIGRFCSYEYVCLSIYMCVFWRDVEVNGF